MGFRKDVAFLVVLGLSSGVVASPKIQDLTGFGGYATALAGRGDGSNPWPDVNLSQYWTPGQFNADWKYTTGSVVTATTSYTDTGVTGQGYANVGLGVLKLSGSNSGSNNVWRNGGGSGGWIDTLRFSAPGQAGKAGLFTFTLKVSGSMTASGFSGASRFVAANYRNKGLVLQNDIFKNAYGPQEIGTEAQAGYFNLTSSVGVPASRVVSKTILFTVPFTFGTAFEHGIFAAAEAKTRSLSGTAGISGGTSDFSQTVTWGGIQSVLDGSGNPVSGWSYTAASGTNWANPVPEPGTILALSAGTVLLLRRRKKN